MSNQVHLSFPAEHIACIQLDNPPVNALSLSMKQDINGILDELDQDIRVLVLTGKGDYFCNGEDLKETVALRRQNQQSGDDNVYAFIKLLERVAQLPITVISAVNGYCSGGGLELALCSDIRIASHNAKFIAAGVNMGLLASTYSLPRLIGVGPAKHMLLTGSAVNSDQALQWGLITEQHSPEYVFEAAMALAKRVASRAPLSVSAAKRFADMAHHQSAQEASTLQLPMLKKLLATQDHKEAVSAFLDKRQPVFNSR